MKKSIIYIMLALFGITAIFYGCKKDKQTTTTQDTDTQTAQDNALADKTFEDVQTMADQAHAAGNGGTLTDFRVEDNNSILTGPCGHVSVAPGATDTTITIDFGTYFCQCVDGRYRKGKVLISFTGRYRDSATVITHTFNNYYVGRDTTTNCYNVQGSKVVTNMGHNSNGHLYFSINVNGQLINHSGQTMTWTSQRQREWIAGDTTAIWSDDQYLITGSASGTTFNGSSFRLTITSALHIALNCYWIKGGTFELIPSGRPTRIVDYGNGVTCDNLATVTINGHTFNITLP